MCLLVHNTIYIESRKFEKHFSRKLLLERVLFLTHTKHTQLRVLTLFLISGVCAKIKQRMGVECSNWKEETNEQSVNE